MPKPTYTIYVSRLFRASIEIDVEAWTDEEAVQKAQKRIDACMQAEAALTVAKPERTRLTWKIVEEEQSVSPQRNWSFFSA